LPGGEAVGTALLGTAVVLCCAASVAGFVGIFWFTWPRRGR
jgi:hypothetical protein